MYSRVTLALVLIALIASINAVEHCIGKAFKATAIIADPSKDFDDQQVFFFDATTNKQRTDKTILEPVRREVSLFYRYDLGKAFEYDRATGQCQSFPLTGSLQPFCLAQDAKHTNDVTIGGTLKCEVWEENIRGFQIRLVIAPGRTFGAPVNFISRGGHHTHVFQEWYDFQSFDTLPDQSVFNLPAACQGKSRSISNNESISSNQFQFLVDQE